MIWSADRELPEALRLLNEVGAPRSPAESEPGVSAVAADPPFDRDDDALCVESEPSGSCALASFVRASDVLTTSRRADKATHGIRGERFGNAICSKLIEIPTASGQGCRRVGPLLIIEAMKLSHRVMRGSGN